MDTSLDNNEVFAINHELVLIMKKSGVDKCTQSQIMLELLKFAVPSYDEIPWLFKKKTDVTLVLDRLFQDLQETKAFKRNTPPPKPHSEIGAAGKDNAGKAKQARRAKPAPKQDESLRARQLDEEGAETTTKIVHDIINAIDSVTEHVPASQMDHEIYQQAVSKAVIFVLTKKYEIPLDEAREHGLVTKRGADLRSLSNKLIPERKRRQNATHTIN